MVLRNNRGDVKMPALEKENRSGKNQARQGARSKLIITPLRAWH